MSSEKKVKANRKNSRHSTGPTSPEGKARSRRNALKSGLFSKELVVAAAGEKQEDYDALLSGALAQFPSQDFLSAFLAKDWVDTIWGLQRVRRYETAEIRKQCDTARYRRHFEKSAEVDSLKYRFIRDLDTMCGPGLADRAALGLSLEETRKELGRRSLGINFLIGVIDPIRRAVESVEAAEAEKGSGFLTARAEMTLVVACGVEDQVTAGCATLNRAFKANLEKFNKDKRAYTTMFNLHKQYFVMTLRRKIRDMRMMKILIEKLERVEEEAHLASLVMPPAEVLEKIHRVEAPLRRNLFKTLDTLLAVFYGIG